LENWADSAIFYHIYPLGLTGAPANNDFKEPPLQRLDVLLAWLPHIRKLGANALYLGPIFRSTAHGYDTADYWHLDPRLGTDETLKYFVTAAHAAGLRVVLDGVFNHVGRDFWAFRDVLDKGATSQFCSWFAGLDFHGHSPYGDPFTYEAWSGCYDLVKLNLHNPDTRNHLLAAVGSWINDFDIDGLRIDAADVTDLGFLAALAGHAKAIKPDFWLFGEVVHGDYRAWANPATLDSITNYECYKGLWSSLVSHNYFEIAYSLDRQFGPEGIYRGLPLYNFVDNHDQDRVASKLGETHLLAPLYLLLFTMPGRPSIYYGSEWGLRGVRGDGDDRPVRPALDLASAPALGSEPELASLITRLSAIRLASSALLGGDYREAFVAPEQLAFVRQSSDETVAVLINASPDEVEMTVKLPWSGEWEDLLNGPSFHAYDDYLRCLVPAGGGRILRAK